MAKMYDAVNKVLVDWDVMTWLDMGDLPPPASKELVPAGSVDLSGYTAASDRFYRIAGAEPYTAHLELQAGPDPSLDSRVLLYCVLGGRKYGWPVFSVVFLLRRQAMTGVTGQVKQALAEDVQLNFRYRTIKVWELPVERLLTGGVGGVPLAPIAAVANPEHDLPEIYRRVWQRIEQQPPKVADDLWGITYVLSGLRHPRPMIDKLMSGVHEMRESSTYQAILAEGEAKGKVEGRREALLQLGSDKFGPPDAATLTTLGEIDDLQRLQSMLHRIWNAATWADLLAWDAGEE